MSDWTSRQVEWITRYRWNMGATFHEVEPGWAAFTFCKALMVCANSGGDLDPRERDWVLGYAAVYGVPDHLLEQLAAYPANDPVEQVFGESRAHTDSSKRAILFDAIGACEADGVLDDMERQTLYRAAEALGVERSTVDELEAAYREERDAILRRIQLVIPGGYSHPDIAQESGRTEAMSDG